MSSSREKLASFYGKAQHFRDYEDFFEREIEQKGIKQTLNDWLFKGDEVSEGLLTRMFAGEFHPVGPAHSPLFLLENSDSGFYRNHTCCNINSEIQVSSTQSFILGSRSSSINQLFLQNP